MAESGLTLFCPMIYPLCDQNFPGFETLLVFLALLLQLIDLQFRRMNSLDEAWNIPIELRVRSLFFSIWSPLLLARYFPVMCDQNFARFGTLYFSVLHDLDSVV